MMHSKAVILCNGEPPDRELILPEIESASLFIAADGGANIALELGLTPDVVIGDMDSFFPDEKTSLKVMRDKNQETNDLEKALAYAEKTEVIDVVVFGATGLRTDQTLKNLSVLKQFNSRFRNILFRDNLCDIFLATSPTIKKFPTGTSISLFPLSGRVENITTKGLKYALNHEFLENGVRDGSSNETISPEVEIHFESGDLLLIVNHNSD